MSEPITLINAFTVPVDETEEFLRRWKNTAAIMAGQPGFVRARMYRSVADDAELRFVNVAEWESRQAFEQVTANPDFRTATQRVLAAPDLHIVPRPAVYEVAVDLRPGDRP